MHTSSAVPLAITATSSALAIVAPHERGDLSVTATEPLKIADLSIDPVWHEVVRGGREIQLTRLEFALLHILALNVNHVVPYEVLIDKAWGYPAFPRATALIKTPISRVRSKAALRPPGPLTINSVSRVGYILNAPV
jgi:two-component system OmpR family response regulator